MMIGELQKETIQALQDVAQNTHNKYQNPDIIIFF